MRLGSIQFGQVEEMLGYKLSEDDKKTWDKYHCQNANLSGVDVGFHVFDIPKSIVFKGKDAGEAILRMFTADKMTKSIGTFEVMEQSK